MRLLGFERRWAAAVLEGFAPPEGPGLAPRPGEVDYAAVHERILTSSPPMARLALRMGVAALALSPLWLFFKPTTFAGLSASERAKILSRLLQMRGPVGEAAVLLKMSASIALLNSPTVRQRSGFDRLPETHA